MKGKTKLTGKPLCLLVRNIETISATFTTRGRNTTFKGKNKEANKKFKIMCNKAGHTNKGGSEVAD